MADEKPIYLLSTFAERQKARMAAEGKAPAADSKSVDPAGDDVEDKAVAPRKATRNRAAKKS